MMLCVVEFPWGRNFQVSQHGRISKLQCILFQIEFIIFIETKI